MEHLVFRLHGTLASWGDIAVGNHRPSHEAPTRSALVGLLGAALGIDRSEADRLSKLSQGLGIAVETRRPGVALRDYHTAQTRHQRSGPAWTRRDELALPRHELETVLTERDYLADVSYVVAMWSGTEDLHVLAKALGTPHYALYLGRRSCPPSLPLAPRVIESPTLAEALAAHGWDARLDDAPRDPWVWTDPHPAPGLEERDTVSRWDALAEGRRIFRPHPVRRGIRRGVAP